MATQRLGGYADHGKPWDSNKETDVISPCASTVQLLPIGESSKVVVKRRANSREKRTNVELKTGSVQ